MRSAIVSLLLTLGLAGCELDEVSLTEPESILLAEVYVMVGDGEPEITAYLHETLGSTGSADLRNATVRVISDTLEVALVEATPDRCLSRSVANKVDGRCYSEEGDLLEGMLEPGRALDLEILLSDGRELRGSTVIPSDIRMVWPSTGVCVLPPGRSFEVSWSRSPGAWAYAAETIIWGLRDALEPLGVEVEADSVALLGLAVSDSDTTIVFPSEFGVFDRFDLDSDLALILQEGLPFGALANVVVAALDRNYVNWVRGGSFNPSGLVRVPSVTGDGTGVFAAVVRRRTLVAGIDPALIPGDFIPSCIRGP
jgi:hypothetical protein